MVRMLFAFLIMTASTTVGMAEPTIPTGDKVARVEYSLQTPRTREPVLGGSRDQVAVRVWIPNGVQTLRGGICNPFSKDEEVSKHWQAACRHWQFAYVQVDFDAVKKEEFLLLATGLTDLAKKTGHPELERLPLCFIGMSRGGGISMQLAELLPERTIACAPVCLEVGPSSEATRRVPVLTIFGEKDGAQMEKLLTKLPTERKRAAQFGIAVQWNRKHEFALANNLSFVFFDDVLTQRLPKLPLADKPTPLATIPLERGWLGDVSTWGKDRMLPAIASWQDFNGDRSTACWFPSRRTAAVWRAFVGASNDVRISDPPGLGDKQPFVVHSAIKPVVVTLTLGKDVQPTRVILWDGDQQLAEKTTRPWRFEISLKAGIHTLIASVDDGKHLSPPHTIVVSD